MKVLLTKCRISIYTPVLLYCVLHVSIHESLGTDLYIFCESHVSAYESLDIDPYIFCKLYVFIYEPLDMDLQTNILDHLFSYLNRWFLAVFRRTLRSW